MIYCIKKWIEEAMTSMVEAGKLENALARERGQIDEDGIPWIIVYVDGGWSKRSYGHSYNALSGVVCN